MDINNLKSIAEAIIINKDDDGTLAIEKLAAFYGKHKQTYSQNSKNEILTNGGYAISYDDSKACLLESVRTTKFIRGIHKALLDLMELNPYGNINVIYAGCGPYATLLLPVLSTLNDERVKAILIDINKDSIESVKNIIDEIGLRKNISDYVVCDATEYTKPDFMELHMVITETMFKALTREPQVAIVANLAPQISPLGILIPQEVSVDMVFTNMNNEPYYDTNINAIYNADKPKQRIEIGTLINVNIDNNLSNNKNKVHGSAWYEMPHKKECPEVCLVTNVRIYGDIILKSGESSITNPYCLTSISNLKRHSYIKMDYDFSTIPMWKFDFK